MLEKHTVLITGGTGSFGQRFTEFLLTHAHPHEVVVFSRDEYKQFEMARRFPPEKYPIRYFLGDVRDKDRLLRAFNGIDIVVHAAALKQVPALEQNPFEAVRTNIIGAQNIVEAALERSVKKVVAISTDKAVNPVNLYGATKLVMEKIFIAANSYVRYRDITFSAVRYGNVVGSRGSVIPYFIELVKSGIRELPVTDARMTRFWITLDQGVQLVYKAITESEGGEVFIPKIPSMKIMDLVKALPGNCTHRVVGIRPGEKVHETLIGEDEGRHARDSGDHYLVLPQFQFQTRRKTENRDATAASQTQPLRGSVPRFPGLSPVFRPVPDGFTYRSDTNTQWLSPDQLRTIIAQMYPDLALRP